MEIKNLKFRSILDAERPLVEEYSDFGRLILEIQKKYIPFYVSVFINQEIEEINSFSGTEEDLVKAIRKGKSRILALIGKELNLVAKNHYRDVWRIVGMMVFGVPIGFAFASVLGNTALLAVGLPLGMIIGMMVGSLMDKKAYENGNQLDIVIKYWTP